MAPRVRARTVFRQDKSLSKKGQKENKEPLRGKNVAADRENRLFASARREFTDR
jgi:hypothetical protein